jgi:hypothetical protein
MQTPDTTSTNLLDCNGCNFSVTFTLRKDRSIDPFTPVTPAIEFISNFFSRAQPAEHSVAFHVASKFVSISIVIEEDNLVLMEVERNLLLMKDGTMVVT